MLTMRYVIGLFVLFFFEQLLSVSGALNTNYPNAVYLGCYAASASTYLTKTYASSSNVKICGDTTRPYTQIIFGLSQGTFCHASPTSYFLDNNLVSKVADTQCATACSSLNTDNCGGSSSTKYWSLWRHNFGPVIYSILPRQLPSETGVIAINTLLTIVGHDFVTQPSLTPVVTFTELVSTTARTCTVTTYNSTVIFCKIPIGQGYSTVSVSVGTLSMLQLPLFPSNFDFFTGTVTDAETANCVGIRNGLGVENPQPPNGHGWDDNWMCVNLGYGSIQLTWSETGPISGMKCVKWTTDEASETARWQNTYLCYPGTLPYNFVWSTTGQLPNKVCISIREPNCPGFIDPNNFLCGDANQPAVLTTPSGASYKYLYANPKITSITPTSGSTLGGYTVTVRGSSFGLYNGNPVFSVGGFKCIINSATYNHTYFVCTVGQGEGAKLPLTLTNPTDPVNPTNPVFSLTSLATNATFSYAAPIATSISPINGSTSGGTLIVVQGSNFGWTEGEVYFDGVKLDPAGVVWNNTKVTFLTPGGTGTGHSVSINTFTSTDSRSQQASGLSSFRFSYLPPIIYSFSPSNGDKQGGYALTLRGFSFGPFDVSASVSVGGLPCISSFQTWNDTYIACTMPSSAESKGQILVQVSGQLSQTNLYFPFNPPVLTTISSQPSSVIIGTVPGPNRPQLVLTGTSFGNGTNSVTPGRNFNLSIATLGGQICSTAGTWGFSSITCPIPAGMYGYSVPVIVWTDGIASNTQLFNFTPSILTLTSASTFPTSGNVDITVTASSMVNTLAQQSQMSLIVKRRISQSAGNPVTWAFTSFVPPTDFFHAGSFHFQLPVGQGDDACAYLQVGSLTSSCYPFVYDPPVLTSVSPTTGAVAGGYTLTLQGSNFGFQLVSYQSYGPSVMLNDIIPCPVFFQNHTTIFCTLSTGAGQHLQVTVRTDTDRVSNAKEFSYASPSLAQTVPNHGAVDGGYPITLIGDQFAPFGAQVAVSVLGGTTTYYNVVPFNQTSIIFTMPSGYGTVQIFVVIASISSVPVIFTYDAAQIDTAVPATSDSLGGGTMVVHGSNFFGLAQVFIGSTPCPLDSSYTSTTTDLYCTIPPGQGYLVNVTVQFTVAGTTSTSNMLPFSYNPPQIDSVNPSTGPTDGTSVLLIVGRSFGLTGSVTIGTPATGSVLCNPTSVNSYTHNSISCRVAEGPPAAAITHTFPVIITSAGQSNLPDKTFTFGSPTVGAVTPSTGPTAGNIDIVILGSNFGVNPVVTFGGVPCALNAPPSHSRLQCSLPSSTGAGINVTVVVNEIIASPQIFAYFAPDIDTGSISPLHGLTQGGALVTVIGRNLGANFNSKATTRVTINGNLATVLSAYPTNITFLTPVGSGANRQIVIDVNGQRIPNLPQFNYDNPTISSMIGCQPDPVQPSATAFCPTSGNLPLTIYGTSFSRNVTAVSVTIRVSSTSSLACPVTAANETRIICTLPGNPVGGFNLLVYTVVDGLKSSELSLLSYGGPTLTTGSLHINDTQPTHTFVSNKGSQGENTIVFDSSWGANLGVLERTVTLSGTFLGFNKSEIIVHYGYIDPNSPSSAFATDVFLAMNYVCDVVAVWDTGVTCKLNEIVGANLTFAVQVQLQFSVRSVDNVNGPQPVIGTPSGMDLADGQSSQRTSLQSRITGVKQKGDIIHFNITGVGTRSDLITVYMYQAADPVNTRLQCRSTGGAQLGIHGDMNSQQYIRCEIPLGIGSGYQFQVVLPGGLTSRYSGGANSADLYSYPTRPVITKILAAGYPLVDNTTTINLPTKGGPQITLIGHDFISISKSITVGHFLCTTPHFIDSTQFTCFLSSSTGNNQPVAITGGFFTSPSVPYVSYAAATVGSIDGCLHGNTDCARSGGTIITLNGANFGPIDPAVHPNPTIIVGGQLCESAALTGAISQQTAVTCKLPSGTATQQPVLYVQGKGTVTAPNVTISYAQCKAGQFAGAGVLNCTDCPAGKYSNAIGSSECISCPSGTYSAAGTSSCTVCNPGSFSLAGSTDTQGCTLCDYGKYQTAAAQASCIPCPAGTYGDIRGLTIACTACPVGNYSSGEGNSACLPCPAGSATKVLRSTTCTNCPAGSVSGLGQSTCTSCQPGYIASASRSTCDPCPAGTYTEFASSSVCLACPSGSISNQSASASCTKCNTGSSTAMLNNVQNSTYCTPCAKGYYSDNQGLSTCIACSQGQFAPTPSTVRCSLCPAGTFNDQVASSSCPICAAGKFSAFDGAVTCSLCDAGFYSLGNTSACNPCDGGRFAPRAGASRCADCVAGMYSFPSSAECLNCPDGYYSTGGQAQCTACDKGKYAQQSPNITTVLVNVSTSTPTDPSMMFAVNYVGQPNACYDCSPGYYTSQTGSVNCLACPSGTIASDYGSQLCTECDAGNYSSGLANTVCSSCEPGKFSAQPKSDSCIPCGLGEYGPPDQSGLTSCFQCGAGFYQDQANSLVGVTACKPCLAGYYQSLPGKSACSACTPGNYSAVLNSTECTRCDPGYYQPSLSATGCISSPAGSFVPGRESDKFTLCAAGTYSTGTNSSCDLCPPGTFSAAGVSFCSVCDAGKFSSAYQSQLCQPCPAGSYAPDQQSSSCTLCEQGKYQQSTGASLCLDCAPGSNANGTGSIGCTLCGGGSYSDTPAAFSCSPCLEGTYSLPVQGSVGRNSCEPCPSGSFNKNQGQAGCPLCQIGTAFNGTGLATDCPACSPGRAAGADGFVDCVECAPGFFGGPATCQACDAGKARAEGENDGVSCTVCPPGRYQGASGQSSCLFCEPGKFTNSYGSLTCTLCDKATFSNMTGATNCTVCSAGTYAATAASLTCSICDAGKASPVNSDKCNVCVAGQYSLVGAGSCLSCPAGRFQTDAQQSSCVACSAGRFSGGGAASCAACPGTQVAPYPGTAQCTDCPEGAHPAPGGITCVCPAGQALRRLPIVQTAAISTSNDTQTFITACQDCPVGADCTVEGTLWESMKATAGYWRTPFVDRNNPFSNYQGCLATGYCSDTDPEVPNNNPQFYRCFDYSHCKGGDNSMNYADAVQIINPGTTCSGGRIGPLCNVCPKDNIQAIGGDCVACHTDAAAGWIELIGIILILIAVLLLMFYVLMQANRGLFELSYATQTSSEADLQHANENEAAAERAGEGEAAAEGEVAVNLGPRRRPAAVAAAGGITAFALQRYFHDKLVDGEPRAKPNFTFKLKILIGFFQIVSNLGLSLDVQWPHYFLQFISFLNPVNLDFVQVSNLGCFLDNGSHYQKLIVICVIPLVVFAGLLVFWLIPGTIINLRDPVHRSIVYQKFWLMFLYTLFLMYPFTSSNIIKTFVCREVNGNNYLVADMNQLCSDPSWQTYTRFAAVMCIFYPIGIPLTFAVILWMNRNKLHSASVRASFGFLFEAYHDDCFWFELLDMLHKFVLTSILLLLPSDAQLATGFGIAGGYAIALYIFKPYLRKSDDRLHLLAQTEIILLFLCGLKFYQDHYYDNFYNILLTIILVMLCVALLGFFILQSYQAWKRWRKERKLLEEKRLFEDDDDVELKSNPLQEGGITKQTEEDKLTHRNWQHNMEKRAETTNFSLPSSPSGTVSASSSKRLNSPTLPNDPRMKALTEEE